MQVSYWYGIVVSYRVYMKELDLFSVSMKGHFMSTNVIVTPSLDWMLKTAHELPVPYSWESDVFSEGKSLWYS